MGVCLGRKRKEEQNIQVMWSAQGHAVTVSFHFILVSICAGFSLCFGMCRGHEFMAFLPPLKFWIHQQSS